MQDRFDGLKIGMIITEAFLNNGNINSSAIGKEYDLKLRNDLTPQSLNVLNVGIDDDTSVFEVVETFNQQIDDNTDEIEIKLDSVIDNQTNKTQYSKMLDSFGEPIQATLANQLMVSTNVRLAGGVFNGSTPDTNFYATTNVANGTATIVNAELILTTTADSGSSSLVNTVAKARQIGGNMNEYRERIRLDVLNATNNTRRWGLFETSALLNAVYFEFKNGILYLVAKTSGLDDIVYQTTYAMDEIYHLYTINYINGGFRCYIDDVLIYEFKETNRIICGTRHLRAFSQNINTGIGSVCHLYGRFMTILMYGNKKTQPKSFLIEGLNAGVLLKVGIGSLHALNLSGVTNLANVTVYDGLNATGTKIYTTGAMGPQTAPLQVQFNDGINFENGLFVTITGAACNAQVIYE